MKNNPSTVHHFIPVFYLENFVNGNGQFYIYKIKERRFKKNGALFSPKSHFFKEHGNTFNEVKIEKDFLESKFYSPLDSDVAEIFSKIKNGHTQPKYGITNLEVVHLEYFFGHLYWRNPATDKHVKEFIASRSLKEMGIVPKDKSKNIDDFEFYIKSHPDYYKIVKGMLPGSLFHNMNTGADRQYKILNYPIGLPGLLGDNPVILKQRAHNNYIEDMIVPLTKQLVYSRNEKNIMFIDTNVKVLIDMMLLKQANEYVCVTDKIYVEQLEDLFNEIYKDTDELKQVLFHGLEKDYGQS